MLRQSHLQDSKPTETCIYHGMPVSPVSLELSTREGGMGLKLVPLRSSRPARQGHRRTASRLLIDSIPERSDAWHRNHQL